MIEVGLVIAGAAVLGIALLFFLKRFASTRMDRRDQRLVTNALLLYWVVAVIQMASIGDILAPLVGIGQFFADCGALIAAIVILRYLYPGVFDSSQARLEPLGAEAIRKYVKEILDSDAFISTLGTAMPRGEQDEKYGLNVVPHVLEAIDRRRQRVSRSARRFLWFTIACALATMVIVGVAAWLLVNDDAVGAPRALRRVVEASESIADSLRTMNADFKGSDEYRDLEQAVGAVPGVATVALRAQVAEKMRMAQSASGVAPLIEEIRQLRERFPGEGLDGKDERYLKKLDAATSALEALDTKERRALQSLTVVQPRLSAAVAEVARRVESDESRVAEIVRRIALGAIVATFFLAILRFIANLYRAEYQQVLRAEFDEMLVRSFYLTYRAAEDLPEQRASVLQSYVASLSRMREDLERGQKTEAVATKENVDLVRELLAAVSKKL